MMKNTWFSTLILALLAPVASLLAQPARDYLQFGIPEGLPHLSVYSIRQSPDGFMWFGTENGLVRFDGYEMKYYDQSTTPALSGSNISSIQIDKSGQIWLGLWGEGINRLDPLTGTIQRFNSNPEDHTTLSDDRAQVLYFDRNERLWAGTYKGGLNRYQPETGTWAHYHPEPGKPGGLISERIWSIAETLDGRLLVGTENGLQMLRPDETGFETLVGPANRPVSMKGLQIRTLSVHPDGWVWFGTDNGLFRIHPETRQVQPASQFFPASIPDPIINQIHFEKSGNIWIGTYRRGLMIYQPGGKAVLQAGDRSSGFNGYDVRVVFEDRTGNIWTGGRGMGIRKYNLQYQKFFGLPATTHDGFPSSSLDILSITGTPDGTVYFGTNGQGLHVLKPGSKELGYLAPPGSPSSGPDAVQALFYDKQSGLLWLGTRNYGLWAFDQRFKPVYQFGFPSGQTGTISGNSIRSILAGSDGVLWVGTKGTGLNRIDLKSKKTRVFINEPENPASLQSNDIRFVAQSADSSLWVGTDGGGISRMKPGTFQFENWTTSRSSDFRLSNNDVTCFFQSPDGKIWIGTDGGGVNIIDPINSRVSLLDQNRTGHPVICGITGDISGQLWIQTLTGITRYNPATGQSRLYRPGDGIPSSIFNINSIYRTSWSSLYMGGIQGVTTFNPEKLTENMQVPPVSLTGFRIFNREWTGDSSITAKKILHLTPEENFFTVSFASLDYVNPRNNRYKYQLTGFDDNWIDAGDRRYASYSNLNGGTYTFRVIGSNNDGLWNPSGASVTIVVHPPFWKTWWFQLLLIVALGLAVWGVIYSRTSFIRSVNRGLESEISKRTTELRDKNLELEKTIRNLHDTQAQLFQQEKMASLGTLVAGVAHEINNPVNFIHSSIHPLSHDIAELIREIEARDYHQAKMLAAIDSGDLDRLKVLGQQTDQQERAVYISELKAEMDVLLKGIESGSNRTAEIVKSLRTFTRVDEDTWKRFPVTEGLDSTIQILSPKWKNRVEVVKDYSDVPDIDCYPGQINQVFMNILVNAFDAIPGSGKVTVRVRKKKQSVEIVISDTGAGIPKDIMERIFEPFFTTKQVGKGTGLGLAISYDIITRHQGTISVSSDAGKGTTFTIVLPVNQQSD